MFNLKKRRKIQRLTQQATVMWIEDLDDLIVKLDEAVVSLRKDLEDLTDFVEDRLD